MTLILSGTDGLSDVDGTAATPAIRGTDANTGIFFPAADTIGFAGSGAEVMRIDSIGRVGIGTTSPSQKLVLSNAGAGNVLLCENTTASIQTYLQSGGTTGVVGTLTNHPFALFTNNTERMRVNAGAPILCLSGGSTSATGTGIAFPATQSASSDANTLDDYEEGTWTPNQGGGLTVVGSFSSNGTYTKVGRMVFVRGVVIGSTSVSCTSGTAITTNLPFSASADNAGAAFNSSLQNGTVLDFTGTSVFTTGAMTATNNIYFSATYVV